MFSASDKHPSSLWSYKLTQNISYSDLTSYNYNWGISMVKSSCLIHLAQLMHFVTSGKNSFIEYHLRVIPLTINFSFIKKSNWKVHCIINNWTKGTCYNLVPLKKTDYFTVWSLLFFEHYFDKQSGNRVSGMSWVSEWVVNVRRGAYPVIITEIQLATFPIRIKVLNFTINQFK